MDLYIISNLFVLICCIAFILTTIPLIKGAPFVPTSRKKVKEMLKVANIKKGELLFDLGSGDGRFLYHASKDHGAKAIGSEISPVLYLYSKIISFITKQPYKVLYKSFRNIDLRNADVVICYLLPERMKELRVKFKNELKPGARIISNCFKIPEWQPSYEQNKILVYEIPHCFTEKD